MYLDKGMSQGIIILTTCGSQGAADQLSKGLIESKLAACVQRSGPIESRYCWKGNQEVSQEWRLVIKSSPKNEQAIISFIEGHHEYELPQINVITMSNCNQSYLSWMEEAIL